MNRHHTLSYFQRQRVPPEHLVAAVHAHHWIELGLATAHFMERSAEIQAHQFLHFQHLLKESHEALKKMATHGISNIGEQAKHEYDLLRHQIHHQYSRLLKKLTRDYQYLFHHHSWSAKRLHERIGWDITSDKIHYDIARACECLKHIGHGIFVVDATYGLAEVAKSYSEGHNWMEKFISESVEFASYYICALCVDVLISAIVATPFGWCVVLTAGALTVGSQIALNHWLLQPYIQHIFQGK